MKFRHWFLWAAAAALVSGCGGDDGDGNQLPRYTLQRLDTIGGVQTLVTGFNDRGDLIGDATDAQGRSFAFAYVGGRMTDLSALYAGAVTPLAINNAGTVAGRCVPDDPSDVQGMEPERPFVYDGATFRQLRAEIGEGGEATAINDAGTLAGRTNVILETEDSRADAFTYSGTTLRLLGHIGSPYTAARAINADGWVTGFGTAAAEPGQSAPPPSRAFLHDGREMRDLGTLGGRASVGQAINADGDVVGWSNDSDGNVRAFLYNEGRMRNLGALDGRATQATGINDAGRVVGTAGDPRGNDASGFVSHDEQLLDLNERLDATSEWRVIEALGIDNEGRILARGRRGTETISILLEPVL